MYAGRIERLLAYYTPAPMCIVNSQGKVSRASQKIADVFKYDNIVDYDIFALTGIKMAEIIEAAKEDKVLYIERNDRIFKIFCSFLGEDENASIMMYFQDVTSYDKLKTMYNEEKVCLALVNIDNYDELAANEGEDREMAILTELDILIRRWASELDAAVIRYRDPLYEIVLRYKDVKQLAEGKFEILDRARSVKTDADFPVTLSIGVGIGGKTMAETDDYAQDALDLAMGRGGDQAVVKNIRNLEFYGGKSQSVEKSKLLMVGITTRKQVP